MAWISFVIGGLREQLYQKLVALATQWSCCTQRPSVGDVHLVELSERVLVLEDLEPVGEKNSSVLDFVIHK